MGKKSIFVVCYMGTLSIGCAGAILIFVMEPWIIGAIVMVIGVFLMSFFLNWATHKYDSIIKRERIYSTTKKEDDLE